MQAGCGCLGRKSLGPEDKLLPFLYKCGFRRLGAGVWRMPKAVRLWAPELVLIVNGLILTMLGSPNSRVVFPEGPPAGN